MVIRNQKLIETLTPDIVIRLLVAPAISTANTLPFGILPFGSAFKLNVREVSFQLQTIRVNAPF
jgi:hypothetical protein